MREPKPFEALKEEEYSGIEWTHYTYNIWWGCTEVSPACDHCYAKALDKRSGRDSWGPGKKRFLTSEKNRNKIWKLDDTAGILHKRYRVFAESMGDWLDPEIPAEWLLELLDVIAGTKNIDWLLLTKRPMQWRSRMMSVLQLPLDLTSGRPGGWELAREWWNGLAPEHVWVGCTAENQEWYDKRVEHLARIPAVGHWLSCEPLLGEIDFGPKPTWIDWVIIGGETGAGARPGNPDHYESAIKQCSNLNVPVFFKQWGDWVALSLDYPHTKRNDEGVEVQFDGKTYGPKSVKVDEENNLLYVRCGKQAAGRTFMGRAWNQYPKGMTPR